MGKTVVLVRHAHRDTSIDRTRDNGLTQKGWDQAKAIRDLYLRKFGPADALLLSSPKTRCKETLHPLGQELQTKVEVETLLDEQGDLSGKSKLLAKRIQSGKSKIVVMCSHGDLIPCFSQEITRVEIDLKKGGWIELKVSDSGEWELIEVVQEPILTSV